MSFSNLMWVVTGVSLFATILNIKKQRICFVIWLFTNSLWCIYDFSIGAYAQSVLFFAYVCLAIWGILEWKQRS
jgi:nicotinamide riboside transporter PnuC